MLRRQFSLIIFFALSLLTPVLSAAEGPVQTPKLTVFNSPSCHNCLKIKNEVMPLVAEKFKGRVRIEYLDIDDLQNFKLLLGLEEKHGVQLKNVFPVFYLNGFFLDNESGIRQDELEAFIVSSLDKPLAAEADLPQVDLVSRFRGWGLPVIVGAGLIDGFNPCAFTVIVFFMSFLALQGYKRKQLIAIGLAFIFAVFLTYILIGIGLFGFLYRVKGFWLVAKIVNLSIGIFSIILGIFALYDFFKFKRTGDTEGLALQLPAAVKNQIHRLIGRQYRKSKDAQGWPGDIRWLIVSSLVTGFLVSILEAICTGQTYLPTLGFILKTTPLKLQALSYIIVYNFMFIVPLLGIFVFALAGATSQQFSKILKRHLLTVKLFMAVIFFALGIFLLWRP